MKLQSLIAPLAAVSALTITSSATAGRDDYETPDYEVIEKDEAFELRDYSEMVVVSAPMKDGSRENSAFMKLFGYISGKNEAGQEIAMTTPVISSTPEDGEGTMSFVVPAKVAEAGAPKAKSSEIVVGGRSAGRFAVYRYSGRWTKANRASAGKKLQSWIEDRGLKAIGEIETASYDPPFTLPFLRRNEVMVRVAR